MKILKKFVYLILLCIFVTAVQGQPKDTSRDEKWIQDINFYAKQLPKLHKNLFFHLSKREFEGSVEELKKEVSNLGDDDIILRLMTLTAQVGDGHTQFNWWRKPEDFVIFPIGLSQFPEGFYAVKTLPAYREILGKKLIKIGGVKIEDIARRLRKVFAAENEFGVKHRTEMFLTIPLVLKAEKIILSETEAEYTFADEKGAETRIQIKAEKYFDYVKDGKNFDFGGTEIPVALRHQDANYSFDYLPDEKMLYLAYNVCADDKTKPFAELTKEIFALVDKNSVEKFVVDLRRNGGGNSTVIKPLYTELEKRPTLVEKGKFFLLMSRQTFSSAFLNAVEMKRKFGAIWVGEPSSQAPVIYGEIKNFELPNSKFRVQYSTKKFVYDDKIKLDYIPVDIAIEETFGEYAKGVDKILEAVFDYKNK